MGALTERGEPRRFEGATRLLFLGLAALGALLLAGALAPGAAAIDPPLATIATPPNNSAYDAGFTIDFSANGSTDPESGPLYFIWDFPGERIEGPSFQVVYFSNFTVPGTYVVRLTVRDNESLEGYANVTVTIRPSNAPPTAVIGAPPNGSRFFTDEFINFSATGSSDPEGGPLAFFWSTNLSGQFGTGENLSVKLPVGRHRISLRAVDNRGGEDTAAIELSVEVNVPPHIDATPVTPATGFEGDAFTFEATYREDNGEAALRVLLVLDGTPHPMALGSGADPRAGQRFTLSLTPFAGRHSFYVLADDGRFTNLTPVLAGPDVWQGRREFLSADGLATLGLAVLPPGNFSVVRDAGPSPPDPAGLVPASPAYRVNGSALGSSNYTLEVAFTPGAGVNASSARLHRLEAGAWLALVTALSGPSNVATVGGTAAELTATFRVFASPLTPPSNAPPNLEIRFSGDFYPNATIAFDGGNSSDPEADAVLLSWNISGPGVATGWLPGRAVRLAFPEVGLYNVSLRGDDGSGNVVYRNITLEVRERPLPPSGSLEEPLTLASLAAAVALSALLALWWRGRGPVRKEAYEDQYGRLYTGRMNEEKEYAQLFEKFAQPQDDGAAPATAPEAPKDEAP